MTSPFNNLLVAAIKTTEILILKYIFNLTYLGIIDIFKILASYYVKLFSIIIINLLIIIQGVLKMAHNIYITC
jgi:hypothetical protein